MTEPSYLPSDNPRVRPSEHPFRHCLPVQIRFSDVDMLGHVNNNVYLTFMDLAKIEYFSAAGNQPVTALDLCMVVAHIDCDFLAPSFLGDDLAVWTRTVAITERSLRLEQRIADSRTGVTKCIGRTVMAGFDVADSVAAPITERWVQATERFEQITLRT